jgi:hypothetical protein
MVRKLSGLGALFCIIVLTSMVAAADTITEVGDAGQTLGTALVTKSPFDLSGIAGNLGTTEADIYVLRLSAGELFTASTVSNTSNFFDTELFLFDGNGLGLVANDDDDFNPPQSALSYLPTESGYYFLAIAGSGFLPESISGLIFPEGFIPGLLDTGLLGPTGAGGGDPLTGWTGTTSEQGGYLVAVTGAKTAIPEPASLAMVAGGLGTILLRRFRKQQ